MKYITLGASPLEISRIVLGCMSYGDPTRGTHGWSLDEDSSRPFFRQAIESGITAFDTANVYSLGSSEEITGRMIREFTRRDDVVLMTKVGLPVGPGATDHGLTRQAIFAQIDASLLRLGTDYVDLYQIHRFDPETPIEETMDALHGLVRAGKVRHLGASSMWMTEFAAMQASAQDRRRTPFISMQDQYNLLMREEEREMHPYCIQHDVGVLTWSPLARGRLTRARLTHSIREDLDEFGRSLYRQDEAADEAIIATVAAIAQERGVSRAQVALAWQFAKPAVTAPIIGATAPHHIVDAVAALEVGLTLDEVARLEAPYTARAPEGFE